MTVTTCDLTHRELTDAEIDQVEGGVVVLPIVAGVVVGAALGAVLVGGALAAVDIYAHQTGKECLFDTLSHDIGALF